MAPVVTPSTNNVVSIYSQDVPFIVNVFPNSEYFSPKSDFGDSANAVKFPRGPAIAEIVVSSAVFDGL